MVWITEQVFSAVSLIAILVLITAGLHLTWGLLGVINLAHGEMLLVGAYATWYVTSATGNIWLGLGAGALAAALAGWVIERTVIQFLYDRPIDTLVATWAVSIVVRQGVQLLFGAIPKAVTDPLVGGFVVGEMTISRWRALLVVVAVLVVLALRAIMQRTSFGLRVRAATSNRELALVQGLPVWRIYTQTFVLGCGLAGLAGGLIAPISAVTPFLGVDYALPAFFVIVIGGVGSWAGMLLGAAIIGTATLGIALPTSYVIAQVLTLLLAIVFVRIRPQGLVRTLTG
jgi:urea transport system permease protein